MDYIVTPDRLRNSLTGTDLRQACSSRHPLGENIRVSQFLGKLLVDFVPSQNALVSNLAVSRVILWKCVCHSSSPVRWLKSCIFTPGTFPRGLGAFGGFFDSLIATLNINDLQSDQFQPHFFFFKSEAMNPFIIFFCSLCSDLSTLRYRRKRTPDGPVTRPRSWLLYSRAQNYM